jgi:hypothetical protein
VDAVVYLMEVMLDPVSRKLASAPLEDAEMGEEEERAASESARVEQALVGVVHRTVMNMIAAILYITEPRP